MRLISIMKKYILPAALITAFLLLLIWAARERVRSMQDLDMKKDADTVIVTVDGRGITLKELSWYILYEERTVEEDAKVYNPETTKDYWNARINGKIVATLVKRTIVGMAVHDDLFYREAKKEHLSLDGADQQYLENSRMDFWEDLLDQQRDRLPASKKYINSQIDRMALAQKYQELLSAKNDTSYENYDWNGKDYEKLLKKHHVKYNSKALDHLRVGEITIHHDHFNVINGHEKNSSIKKGLNGRTRRWLERIGE